MNFTEMLFNRDERLLQYILNLQEEIDKLTAESTEWESKFYDLQEKNKKLQAELDLYKDNCEDMNKRIENAIDFINIYTDGINLEAFDCLKLMYKIRDILEGENNEKIYNKV